MARTAALPILTAEPGLTHYLEEIRRFPMLERQEEYMLAKRWREHGDRDAADKLVTSHLRLVAKVARDYSGYSLPISEVMSEGIRRKTLVSELTVLDERERCIFEGLCLAEDPLTLAELAEEFGVSRERVRQIKVNTFKKVQKAVKSRVAAMGTPAPLAVH
jgi:DNA-directed RNA polymerase sigma subunit (sigma70/sigma32)